MEAGLWHRSGMRRSCEYTGGIAWLNPRLPLFEPFGLIYSALSFSMAI
jgi:hypothetical protein